MTTNQTYEEQLSNIEEKVFKSEIEKTEYIKKLKYYMDKKLYNRLYGKTIEKHNENYEKPCLEFQGAVQANGYCRIKILDKNCMVNRISYALSHNIFYEDIPTVNNKNEALVIRHGHNCSKLCVEPTHLSIGRQVENNYDDKIRDGTIGRGDNHHSAKISEELAKDIKHSKGEGTQKERADKFGVSKYIVSDIDIGKTWSYIPDKNGNVFDNSEKRKINRERQRKNKNKEFVKDDWVEALRRIKQKSIEKECEKVEIKSPCHIYQGACDKMGYGIIGFKGISFQVHVLACEAKYNTKNDKEVVRHLCDNKVCCNPDHLEFGTSSQNRRDSISYSKSTKLKESDIPEIRILAEKGELTHKQIGELYNISASVITQIKNGKAWSHIK
jgi:hypothetical protein